MVSRLRSTGSLVGPPRGRVGVFSILAAAAFVAGLAVTGPHSVHHLGDGQGQPQDSTPCLFAWAWQGVACTEMVGNADHGPPAVALPLVLRDVHRLPDRAVLPGLPARGPPA